MSAATSLSKSPSWLRGRELDSYPETGARRGYLFLVVAITISLYYELYVVGGVSTLLLVHFQMPFNYFVVVLALGNLAGAFASLLAGLSDRYGRANLIIYGLLVVGLITALAIPNAPNRLVFSIESILDAFVEGMILVTTPALIRDFSPQVGRATAMGFWTIGPVLGSLMVSLVVTLTLGTFGTWQSQFEICGGIGLVMFVVAFFLLRELAPSLRDQIMVSLRDQALVEARARGLKVDLQAPFRQLLHVDVLASALGVSILLMFYYTAVAFGTIYLVTVFSMSVADANALANWTWGTNAVGLIVFGMLSDRFRVRKPFMLVGGLGAAILSALYLSQAGQHPSYSTLVVLSCLQSLFTAAAYTTWMASFTETVEARNPALTGTGLAIWGWIQRLVVTASFLAIPHVINAVTPLISAGPYIAAFKQAQAAHVAPSPALLAQLGVIQQAAAASPGQWRLWYWICVGGIVVFIATVSMMRGRWSPAAARADEAAHDQAVAREMSRLTGSATE